MRAQKNRRPTQLRPIVDDLGLAAPRGCAPSLFKQELRLLCLRVLFYVSLSYSRTRANLRCLLVFRTPPSSNRLDCSHLFLVRSSIAHRELVQRLHWRLGLARRSRIARVIFRQIGIISSHRKIGHLSYINWYQISRLIGEFIECFFPTVHKTT
jgi:hypothetical protein